MILTRTPYRVSFFGGGTDYHTWYEQHGGQVLSTTINHYVHLICRYLPPFFDHKHKIVWRMVEDVNTFDEIRHPAVGKILNDYNVQRGLEIHYSGDLPARSGLGSSSSFTVGLIHALKLTQQGKLLDKHMLAKEAIRIERQVLQENVGVQDQIAASFGGFNKIRIDQNGNFSVNPIILDKEVKRKLEGSLFLFFTGISRTASDIASHKINALKHKQKDMKEIASMVDEAIRLLAEKQVDDFGRLLHETWMLKKNLSNKIAPQLIDTIYNKAISSGALGGKLLGAGGGGFMLFYVPESNHGAFLAEMDCYLRVPFRFETEGAKTLFFEESPYSEENVDRRNYLHLEKQRSRSYQT